MPQTERLGDSDYYRALLRRQAWKAIAHLVRGLVGDGDENFTGAAWEERKKLAAKLKIRWDVDKQNYVAE